MKQLLTILCLVLLSSYSYSEDLPLNGPYEMFYENGQLEFRGTYKDGKGEGFREVFYENGQLRIKGNLKDGELDGLWKWFHDNGQLRIR